MHAGRHYGDYYPGPAPVSVQPGAYTITGADCGSKIIDPGATAAHTYTISSGLPTGCHVAVVMETAYKLTLTNAAGEVLNYLSLSGTVVPGSATAGATTVSPLNEYGPLYVDQETGTTATISTASLETGPTILAPSPTAIASASAGTLLSGSNNIRGGVTLAAGTTNTTITFGAVLPIMPVCTLGDSTVNVTPSVAASTSTIVLTVAAGLGAANTIYWHCF